LGGTDIDACLADFLRGQLEAHLGSKVESLEGAEQSRLKRELSRHARTLKEQLSVLSQSEVVLALDWAPRDATLRLDRHDLARITEPFLERATMAVQRCLAAAAMAADQVDKVLLVGGSSSLTGLSQTLSERFGFHNNVFRDEEPSTAIARGAAIHAAAHRGTGVAVETIASSELGIMVASGMFPAFQTLIVSGARLPISCIQSFSLSPGQTEVCIPLAVRASGSRRHRIIDTLKVTTPGAEEMPRQVAIQFQIDKQGTLDVQLLARDQVLARKAFPVGSRWHNDDTP
jgi:molecular chaperone DnaK